MKISIRKFLLVNLLLAITVTTTLTAIGNYYLDQKDIQEHLDSLMAISTMSSQALLGENIHKRPLKKIQADLDAIPEKINTYFRERLSKNAPPLSYVNKFNFQIWNKKNELILHSSLAPKLPLMSEKTGFSDVNFEGQDWRIFTAVNKSNGIKTVTAERYNTRNELGLRIAQDDIYIMLLTFPLSGLLIWFIIGKGLDSLDSVAKEVANRAPSHLKPVDLEGVPEEIRPVIDELNQLFVRLQSAFDREKRFAADAAHELRTPLAALKAHAQVALKTNDPQERKLALVKLISGVDRCTHIVQQLLTMSRLVPEASHINDMDNVNLIALSSEVVANLAPAAIEKQIDIELLHTQKTLFIRANYTAVSILLRNLIDNAIRYIAKEGRVSVRISDDDNSVFLRVIDNGPGIPKELQTRVFERFFRVLGSKSPGSGLGLAIVQQIAQLHGASVDLASVNPQQANQTGLIFTVTFPKAPSKQPLSHRPL